MVLNTPTALGLALGARKRPYRKDIALWKEAKALAQVLSHHMPSDSAFSLHFYCDIGNSVLLLPSLPLHFSKRVI